MEELTHLCNQIFNTSPHAAGLILLNLILIESLLSIDNAAVLATMVMDLPAAQRGKALKYGILGAYFFRGLCLIFAAWLITIWWLKPLGGLYLLYITYNYFKTKSAPKVSEKISDKKESRFYKYTTGLVGQFWATVLLIEMIDLAFSLDNVFAAVALSSNIILVMTGVFIGILSMRFVAQLFVKLIEKFPFLKTCAFVVIGVLGVKLSVSVAEHFFPQSQLVMLLKKEHTDLITSFLILAIFVFPWMSSLVFNYPKRKIVNKKW